VLENWTSVSGGTVQATIPNYSIRTAGDSQWTDAGCDTGTSCDPTPFDSVLVGDSAGVWYTITIDSATFDAWTEDSLNAGFVLISRDSSVGVSSDRWFWSFNAPQDSLKPYFEFYMHLPLEDVQDRYLETHDGVFLMDSYNGQSLIDKKD